MKKGKLVKIMLDANNFYNNTPARQLTDDLALARAFFIKSSASSLHCQESESWRLKIASPQLNHDTEFVRAASSQSSIISVDG